MFSLMKTRVKNSNIVLSAEESEVDITPMLDVIFIMLIFFIVTASFVKESGIGINRPNSSALTAPSTAPIVVEVFSNNVIRIQNQEVTQNAIKSTIVRLRAESPEASVIVRLDPNAKTEAMIAAVDGIRAAKVELPSVSLIET